MNYSLLLIIILVLLFPKELSYRSEFRVISFEEFEELTYEDSDKLRIYNFWATWCAPCVREMPYFEKAKNDIPDLDLIFISMDDGRNPSRVTDFIQKRAITSPVFLLDDVDFNNWIDKVDPSWSGAIPATLFIKPNGERRFHEGELEEEDLNLIINQLKQTKP